MSAYVRELRARVGSGRLLLPSVTALVRDERGRLLLVRQRDGGVWSTPGGAIDPDETPADAVVRECWEETGLLVEPVRLFGVYGGPEFIVRYANGDESQYVMALFECAVRSGTERADEEETVEVRYVSASEARELPLTPWLRHVVDELFRGADGAPYRSPKWRPPR